MNPVKRNHKNGFLYFYIKSNKFIYQKALRDGHFLKPKLSVNIKLVLVSGFEVSIFLIQLIFLRSRICAFLFPHLKRYNNFGLVGGRRKIALSREVCAARDKRKAADDFNRLPLSGYYS